MSMTSGSLLKIESSGFPNEIISTIAASRITAPSARHSSSVLLQRLSSPAPKFCPTKVVQA